MLRYDPQHEAGHRMRACLRSSDDSPTDSLEQQLCLLAITVNPAVALPAFLVALRRDHAGRLTAIRTRGKLDLDDERTLLALARCIT